MFDEDDYYSQEQDTPMMYRKSALSSKKTVPSSKVLAPSSQSDFNHMSGQSESLLRVMKDRGFDTMQHPKQKHAARSKEKERTGYFDGGASASLQELMKALSKAFAKADPQQASCILSHVLDKQLSKEDRSKFGILKCKVLFGLGAYAQCLEKSTTILMQTKENKLTVAVLSNYIAKCRDQLDQVLDGYMHFLRAKALINQCREEMKKEEKECQSFADSEIDTFEREINHTEMEYNIKMKQYKNNTNLVTPCFKQFRHRKVLRVVCGDYHCLFLVSSALNSTTDNSALFSTEVFGMGENSVGQIVGRPTNIQYKEPFLIAALSGKDIRGIWATRESSLAYDNNGNVYQWGIKQDRNDAISITYKLEESIIHLQKGYQHYAALTSSKKFYTWGTMLCKNVIFLKQPKTLQPITNVIQFSCGNNHTFVIDTENNLYAVGSNEYCQLGGGGQRIMKAFKKISEGVKKAFCIQDASYIINTDSQVYYCGRLSYNKQQFQQFRQGEFNKNVNEVIHISGTVGNYYVSGDTGQSYHWDVDAGVKFKVEKETQRYVTAYRGQVLRVKTLIEPKLTQVHRVTMEPKSYQQIVYAMQLYDQFGQYGCEQLVQPLHCQIFLSTYKAVREEVVKENKLYLENVSAEENYSVSMSEIVEKRLINYSLSRNNHLETQEGKSNQYLLKIQTEESGMFYFYVFVEEELVYQGEIKIEVSDREKQLAEKNNMEKQMKNAERKRKAEMEKQRLLQMKIKKEQQDEEKKRQTQKRAEDALKRHLREQQQQKNKQQDERRLRKQLFVGGGFDLTKLKNRFQIDKSLNETSSKEYTKPTEQKLNESIKNSSELSKTSQSFLPDINARPVSRRKVILPSKGELSKGIFQKTVIDAIKPKVQVATKNEVVKGKTIVKRGLSKKKQ